MVVPMNGRMREVFNKQKRSGEYVFTSAKTNGRLIDVKKAFNTARLEQGFQISIKGSEAQLCDAFVGSRRRVSDSRGDPRSHRYQDDQEILTRHARAEATGVGETRIRHSTSTSRQNVRKEKRQGARPAVSH